MMLGGAACVDITPPPGLLMTGYAARTKAAIGAHDALTVRAVVLDDTAIVVADVIGLHEHSSLRVRERAPLPEGNILLAALHNHGAPASMPGRLGEATDPAFLEHLENACVRAIEQALRNARPCRLIAGHGTSPRVARNRRHAEGLVDDTLPVVKLIDQHRRTIAVVTAYACHPVVLGADNLLYTADYPHAVRLALEQAHPGAVALFITGAAADANSGHSAQSSVSLVPNVTRTFHEAERIGLHIARCAEEAALYDAGDGVQSAEQWVNLSFEQRETLPLGSYLSQWRSARINASPAEAALLKHWIHWAERCAKQKPTDCQASCWPGRVTALTWGGVRFIGLPGEIFAATGHAVRSLSRSRPATAAPESPVIIAGYAESNPGYIPPAEEFSFGGYEIDEAHRYYGQCATFAPDSCERLLQAVATVCRTS